jgi:hypothetical protein
MFPRNDRESDDMTNVSNTVSPYSTAGSGKACGGKHKHAHHTNSTTGATGNAFELMLNGQANSDGTATDPLTAATSESATGSDLGSAYQSLLSTLQAGGGMDDTSAAQPNGSANQNTFVDSLVNELSSKLNLDAKA